MGLGLMSPSPSLFFKNIKFFSISVHIHYGFVLVLGVQPGDGTIIYFTEWAPCYVQHPPGTTAAAVSSTLFPRLYLTTL